MTSLFNVRKKDLKSKVSHRWCFWNICLGIVCYSLWCLLLSVKVWAWKNSSIATFYIITKSRLFLAPWLCFHQNQIHFALNLSTTYDSFESKHLMSNKNSQLILIGKETRESVHTYIHLSGMYSRMLRTLFRKSTFIIKFLELNKSQRIFNSTLKSIYKKNSNSSLYFNSLATNFQSSISSLWTFKQKIQINKFSYFQIGFFFVHFQVLLIILYAYFLSFPFYFFFNSKQHWFSGIFSNHHHSTNQIWSRT